MQSRLSTWRSRVSPPFSRPSWAAGLTVGFLLWHAFPVGAAQELPPVLTTTFEIQANAFAAAYKATDRADCQNALSAELARLGAEYFACFRWAPGHPVPATNSAAGLTLALTEEDLGYGFEVSLVWSKSSDGRLTGLRTMPVRVLYPATRIDQPTHDPRQLTLDVLGQIRTQLENEANRKGLQDEFLSTIPLTRNLDMATDVERVLLPIPWERLQATDESVLLARFQTQPAGAAALPVSIKMVPKERNLPGAWNVNIGCLVIEFDCPPISTGNSWHPLIRPSFDRRIAGTPEVFILQYKRDYRTGTTEGLAEQP